MNTSVSFVDYARLDLPRRGLPDLVPPDDRAPGCRDPATAIRPGCDVVAEHSFQAGQVALLRRGQEAHDKAPPSVRLGRKARALLTQVARGSEQ